ncbi:MAG: Smr/MutS family protein [Nitrospinota bacterium]
MTEKTDGFKAFARAARALDFEDIRKTLAGFCKTETGAAICRALTPTDNAAHAETMLNRTGEMMEIAAKGEKLFNLFVADSTPVLEMAMKGKLPEPEDIKSMLSFLRMVERLDSFKNGSALNAPNLAEVLAGLPSMDDMILFFDATFDGAGMVKKTATARMMELDSRISSLKQKINARAEKMLQMPDIEEKLQDSYVTIRNDRVVLPIKAEYKNVFSGIIHGISATDKTAFMEPQELVRDNNTLQEAVSELEEEVYSLVRRAAQMLRDSENEIEDCRKIMGGMDAISASARFSAKIKGTRPEFSTDGSVELRKLRHPMMAFRKEKTVPNSLEMGPGEKTFVISGPNMGGKTVLLKSVGLAPALSSCGIFPPMGEGSRFPFVQKLYALSGDEQSIVEGQSTFSASLNGLKEALQNAGTGTWVIVDEILHGTDPSQANALAEAILDYLMEKGCRSFVSTHLPGLKITAQEDPSMVNGAMGMDERGRPNFKLTKGQPGISHPLNIAQSVGIPMEIIETAREKLSTKEDRYHAALLGLQSKTQELERVRGELESRERHAREINENLQAELETARREYDEFKKEKWKRLKAEISKARNEMAEMIESARDSDKKKRAEVSAKLKEREDELTVQLKRPESVPLETLNEGDPVWIIPLDRKAKLVKIAGDKVELISSGVRMTLPSKDVMGMREDAKPPQARPVIKSAIVDMDEENEISLLGLTGDEAIPTLEKFLDTHLLAGTPSVTIIHGKGVLKAKVIEYLETSSYVGSFQPAPPNRGGDGATTAFL